jgi:hypothetical protein
MTFVYQFEPSKGRNPRNFFFQTSDFDDLNNIIKRCSTLVSQVDDVWCYFGNPEVFTKLKLLYAYCNCLHVSGLRDLQNSNIESQLSQYFVAQGLLTSLEFTS